MNSMYRMLFCLLTVLFPWRSIAGEPIIWGVSYFPPYLYLTENGQPHGSFADIGKNLFKHINMDYKVKYSSNRRARMSTNKGHNDFSIGPLITLEDPSKFYISRNVVDTIDMHVYWIGDKKPVFQVNDLAQQSVILIASFNYSGLRDYVEDSKNNVEMIDVENHKRALMALGKGRAKYMLGYKAPTELMQLEMNIKNLRFNALKKIDVHLIINKDLTNGQQIMDRLDNAYFTLYPNNTNKVNID